ncbi:MAG: aldolase catalytic domain-containing protein [Butyrivibrio sp.]|nr:aldolase catalytic domain-containing protein [Butyrivibrio sp.]
MDNIHVLDCTLRDGGYCNNWRFGRENIKKIINGLQEANIEIIECGFITNRIKYDPDVTKFTSFDEISKIIPKNKEGKIFVAMINYGEFDEAEIPEKDGCSLDGIRVAYHKKNRFEALEYCRKLKKKGYLVFVQAMVSLSYSDEEFLDTIKRINEIKPYAFYIVDSFGMMRGKELMRLFYMVEHNLDNEIWIGFHSHNNMQLAYSNAQKLIENRTDRMLIIDSSVYGMGRGAGNLNTELFVEYLNDTVGKEYILKPLLMLIDEILNEFYQRNYWGYSLPNYISASHGAHPNYAGYLDDKKTLTYEDMNNVFDMMDDVKKVSFDRLYIEELYLSYMETGKVQEERKADLKKKLLGKTVILVAPGRTSIEEKEKIIRCKMSDVVLISINHVYSVLHPDLIFISNLRRFREFPEEAKSISIVTSNITSYGFYLKTSYKDLLNSEEGVKDNAGLMAIKFLMEYGVDKVFLAGFDGYSHDVRENYSNRDLEFITRKAVLDAMNIGMSKVLKEYKKKLRIEFLTSPKQLIID